MYAGPVFHEFIVVLACRRYTFMLYYMWCNILGINSLCPILEKIEMIKNDAWIEKQTWQEMISPGTNKKERVHGVSRGLSSYGYDVSLSNEWKAWTPGCTPKLIDLDNPDTVPPMKHYKMSSYVLEPGDFVLATTRETISMPDNVTGLLSAKSTWVRLGVMIPPTVAEAGWSGQIVIEIYNAGRHQVSLREGQGIAQLLFLEGDKCLKPYGQGKYQNQRGVQEAVLQSDNNENKDMNIDEYENNCTD